MQNYRCFDDRTMLLESNAVLVGKNNAGKPPVIEALRIVGAVANRKGAIFVPAPKWLGLPRFQLGIAPGISQLGLNLNAVFHRYQDPPAIITASFEEGAVVTVYVGKQETVFATVQANDNWITTPTKFLRLKLPWISVLPQIGPLLTEEYRITDERVSEYLNSRLSSRHFRNQLVRMSTAFHEFKQLAEETWHGLRVDPIQQEATKDGLLLSLPIRDGDFVSEVGWMGHGLQMWLQTIWFLSRTPTDHTVVLDEPDVYMHPDLQRKLFRLTRARFRQCVIATHSVEIMAESEPSNALVVDKTSAVPIRQQRARRAAIDRPNRRHPQRSFSATLECAQISADRRQGSELAKAVAFGASSRRRTAAGRDTNSSNRWMEWVAVCGRLIDDLEERCRRSHRDILHSRFRLPFSGRNPGTLCGRRESRR